MFRISLHELSFSVPLKRSKFGMRGKRSPRFTALETSDSCLYSNLMLSPLPLLDFLCNFLCPKDQIIFLKEKRERMCNSKEKTSDFLPTSLSHLHTNCFVFFHSSLFSLSSLMLQFQKPQFGRSHSRSLYQSCPTHVCFEGTPSRAPIRDGFQVSPPSLSLSLFFHVQSVNLVVLPLLTPLLETGTDYDTFVSVSSWMGTIVIKMGVTSKYLTCFKWGTR